jgi:hypothetical protein
MMHQAALIRSGCTYQISGLLVIAICLPDPLLLLLLLL